jgi:hypothetical protein
VPGYSNIDTVSCTSKSFCLGVLYWGEVSAFDGQTWSDFVDSGLTTDDSGLGSAACVSPTYCVVIGGSGSSAVGGLTG